MQLPYRTSLFSQDLAQLDLPEKWVFGLANKVHFHELDMLKHVNNAAYMHWYEDLRVAYFHEWEMTRYSREDPRFVVRHASIDYLKEMKMDESYVVVGRTASFRRTSFKMEYAVYSGDLRATGEAVVVMLEPREMKKRPIPEALIERFTTVDKAVFET